MPFDYQLVKDLLVCPVTKAELVLHESSLVSCSPERRLSYPVQDGIPRLLEDDATELEQDVWADIMKHHGRDCSTGHSVSG